MFMYMAHWRLCVYGNKVVIKLVLWTKIRTIIVIKGV